jgi:hypothetical protein
MLGASEQTCRHERLHASRIDRWSADRRWGADGSIQSAVDDPEGVGLPRWSASLQRRLRWRRLR